jgi:uncharacterized membrane protein YhaH (DUF805 family)
MSDPSPPSARRWLRLVFGFEERVDQRSYVLVGVGLMVFKYAVEANLVWNAIDVVWSPLDFLNPQLKSRFGPRVSGLPFAGSLQPTPQWLAWTLVLWTLPFIWVGVSMSMRRAADAGRSPWLALLFFLPWANYALMLVLSVLPTAPGARWASVKRAEPHPRVGPLVASGALGVLSGLGMIAIQVEIGARYTTSLFFGAPLVFGCVTSFLANRRGLLSLSATWGLVFVAMIVLALLVLTVALEGIVCIMMALIPAVPLALAGAALGRALAGFGSAPGAHALLAVIAVPLVGLAGPDAVELPLREVRSSIEIAAPPEVVWSRLVAFGAISEPPEWPFRIGVACPTGARIEGVGPGATRYCEFTTGAFVEPVTAWEPPRRLAFDVAAQPPPMVEWSPYDIHPPHLDGFLRSRRGEFRLAALPSGGTLLEGSTWYTLDIHPGPYWALWADFLIGSIHDRVLRHVRSLSEAR